MSISFSISYPQLEADFASHGIPTQAPAFYDHPKFLSLEQADPGALIAYARFVQTLPYEQAYLERARTEIPQIVRHYFREVKDAGRKGACTDASLVLMRILEKEGFWVSAFKSALSIVPGPASGFYPTTFYAFGGPLANVPGHVWLAAPPFQIIDVTVKLQPYEDEIATLLPDFVLADSVATFSTGLSDIADAAVTRSLVAAGLSGDPALKALDQHLPQLRQVFPGMSVSHGMTILRYAPTGVTASTGTLEKNKAMHFSKGRLGTHVYQETILPVLKRLRSAKSK